MKMKKNKGFSLVELLFAVFIAMVVFSALLTLVQSSLRIQSGSQDLILANNAARNRIEDIRTAAFDTIVATYHNRVFDASGFTVGSAKGRSTAVYVAGSGNELIDVRVVVCFRGRDGKVIGEDDGRGGGIALDGVLNGGEDVNGNGLLDSPCVLVTAIRKSI